MTLPDDITLRLAVQAAGLPVDVEALSASERAAVASFGSEKRRRAFALGRTAARSLLAERLATAAGDVPLRVAADGAPEVEGAALHLSISHVATDEQTLAVAAVAPHSIGVDLELIQPRRPDLYRFLLAPEDYGLLDALPHAHDEAQVLIWAIKEAVLKGLRTGFRRSPKALRLAVEAEAGYARVRIDGERGWDAWFERRGGCFLAVAIPGADE